MKSCTRQILRRESFGGLFYDTGRRSLRLLTSPEFEVMRGQYKLELHQNSRSRVQLVDVTANGLPLLTDALSAPINLYIELTRNCSKACSHCYAASSLIRTQEMTLEDLAQILKQFRDGGGAWVRLTGGEPTLRSDFFELLDILQSLEIVCALNTNADYDQAFLLRLIERGVQDFRVSLDGTEKTNDAIRWKGSFRRVWATLYSLSVYNRKSDSPVDVTINTVLMRSNQQDVRALIELASTLGHKISFGLLRVAGRARASEMLSPAELARVVRTAEEACRDFQLPPGAVRMNYISLSGELPSAGYRPFPLDGSRCPFGITGFALSVEGRIVPCGYFVTMTDEGLVGEQIRSTDLLRVWHTSEVLRKVRNIKRPHCGECVLYKVRCCGGCPMSAYAATRDLEARDPYCLNAPITESFSNVVCV